jgi:uncharacterized protein YjaG (DUF416 family)
MVTTSELNKALIQYSDHRSKVCQVFNDHAKRRNLPIKITASGQKAPLAAQAVAYVSRGSDDTGIIHEEQAKTAVECLFQLWRDEKRQGLVLGAMQSGKTTTSLTLQWAGPALYLLTGQRTYPFYLISSQTNHADQTKIELQKFLSYYGDLEFEVSDSKTKFKGDIDAVFDISPTLATYRDHVLKDAIEDVHAVVSLDEIVHRRVHGKRGVQQIAGLYRRAVAGGYRPLMIIDEPQFGAGDRVVVDSSGTRRAPCLLTQIFQRIEDAIGSDRKDHWFVGLSATPFELNDLSNVWRVRQYLSPAYSGYNFFGGDTISDNVAVNPPTTMGLTEFATWTKVPFVANISMRAYDGSDAVFQRFADKIGYTNDQEQYQAGVEKALKQSVLEVLHRDMADTGEPAGFCIRAFNDNGRTEDLIERLRFPAKKVEIVRYFGSDATGFSVKRTIARRKNPHLPYIVFVTNRARMADAFPSQVRYFLDFAHMASNLNALLQGLLGRACGYNKRSTVIMSDTNKTIIDAYTATTGGYVHRTSPHSTVVGGFRRGAPSGMIKIRRDMADSKVADFFSKIDKDVVGKIIEDGSVNLSPPRSRGNSFRTGPILSIADKIKLFDHLESKEVREALFPEMPSGFHVARAKDKVKHSRDADVVLGYALDKSGNCRYTFRRMDENSVARGGAAGRAKGARDTGQHIEPTIYVEKYNQTTGKVVAKGARGDKSGGSWRAAMVTFPLREPVREIQWSTLAFPTMLSPYDDLMTVDEQEQRDAPRSRAMA